MFAYETCSDEIKKKIEKREKGDRNEPVQLQGEGPRNRKRE